MAIPVHNKIEEKNKINLLSRFNILVPDIKETYARAVAAGCAEAQPVTELADYGVSNAIFTDSFGYLWMLHQTHKEVSFKRTKK